MKVTGDWVGKVGHDVLSLSFFSFFLESTPTALNFVPLKRKKRDIKEKEPKKGGYENISNKEKKAKKK